MKKTIISIILLLIIIILIYFYYNINIKEEFDDNKKTIVLDLDETLVHSVEDSPGHYITYKRPHVDEFLDYVSKNFRVVLFTAGTREYAEPVSISLDPNNTIFYKKFYRDSCIFRNNIFFKNLYLIQNDMSSIFIIDDSPAKFGMQPNNGIPIKAWYDDPNDKELLNFIPLLEVLKNANDVRPIIIKYKNN